MTKHEEVTKQGFCKQSEEKSALGEVSYYNYSLGGVEVSAYLSLIGRRRGCALIQGWALINFFCLQDWRLFEVGANSRLGAYSNKYGKLQLLNSMIIFKIQVMIRNVFLFLKGQQVARHSPFNPLSPNSDQHQFSPNNIHTTSRDQVMRIIKMITRGKMLFIFYQILPTHP